MIENPAPETEDWWLLRLLGKLRKRNDHLNRLQEYVDGTQGVPLNANRATREAYRRLARMAGTNYAELIVEAVRERMTPTGFRTGAEGDELGDREAWRIWQANSLDADHSIIDRTALSLGVAYAIVGPIDAELEAPLITAEDPRQVITDQDPARRRSVLAGLKTYADDIAAEDVAYLYLPGRVLQARRRRGAEGFPAADSEWEWSSDESTGVDVVPVVPFILRPSTVAGVGQAEFERHTQILDRINYTMLNRLEAMTMQAFRQRAIKGLPLTDSTGADIDYDDVFSADPGALWQLPATAEMWESGLIDLTPILESIKADARDLAAVTRTPMTYLFPDAAGQSAEGAALAREGLVFKTQDRIAQASESYETVMALAFAFAGDTVRARRSDMEVLWSPPERFSLAERADAAVKASSAGVPWRTVMADIFQFSPQQIDRMESERATDVLMSDLFAPSSATAPTPPVTSGQ